MYEYNEINNTNNELTQEISDDPMHFHSFMYHSDTITSINFNPNE